MRYLNWVIVLAMVLFGACATPKSNVKKYNSLLPLLLPLSSERTRQVYDHAAVKSYRLQSDCGYSCPDVDIWQYKYKDKKTNKIVSSNKPISIDKKYWKSPDEARIISIGLFGTSDFYYKTLLQYLDSFSNIKKLNNITDNIWGYETFTPRIYVAKRNPADLEKLGQIKNQTPDYMIDHLLDLGAEIAFVDNKREEVKKDGTFWHFAVAADEMPPGQRIRYIVRDADHILIAAEMYAVADWINSGKRFHRMHIIPICIGPMTASLWGGTHTGKGDFSDFRDLVKNFPYRLDYGDDELFTRDLMWPRIKSIGSVLTHHFPRGGFTNTIASPYKDSCEEPTQKFCLKLNANSDCEDRILPETKTMGGVVEALGDRSDLGDLVKKHPHFFDLELNKPERQFIYRAFKSK